jgi:hypothetical protein
LDTQTLAAAPIRAPIPNKSMVRARTPIGGPSRRLQRGSKPLGVEFAAEISIVVSVP